MLWLKLNEILNNYRINMSRNRVIITKPENNYCFDLKIGMVQIKICELIQINTYRNKEI